MKRYAVLLTSVLLLSACGGSGGSASTPSATPDKPSQTPSVAATATPQPATVSPSEGGISSPTSGSTNFGDKNAAMKDADVQAAVKDLVTKKSIDQSKVQVVSFNRVEWSDGSMGCPNPDKMYIQALQEGRHLVLSVDGVKYSYHGGKSGGLMLCEKPTPPARVLEDK